MNSITRHEDCPDADKHSKEYPAPWQTSAMAKLQQTQCPTCGFWVIFTERSVEHRVLKLVRIEEQR